MQPAKLGSHLRLFAFSTLIAMLAMAALATPHPPSAQIPNLQPPISNLQPPISNLQPPISSTQQPATSTVYVPLILRNSWGIPKPLPAFGTEFAPFQEEDEARYADVVEQDLRFVQRTGFSTIRTQIYWREIEPTNTTPENFDWARYDQRLRDYREYGLDPLVGIVGHPDWATRYACGGGFLDGMAPEWRQFVRALAEHYSQPPFNVHIWEIGNEVDGETTVDPEDAERPPSQGHNEPTWPFGGCWGDMASEYVGFLRMAYEEIKAVDSGATVMLGSLAYTEFDHWFIRDFFDNFLAAGGGAYTDVIGFHWFKGFQVWPTAVEKARELRETMAAHDVDKPMWLTETYVPDRIRDPETGQEHDNRPARYKFITQEIPRTLGSGEIERVYWFSFSDWPAAWSPIDRGLVTRDHQPKPGLKVFEIMATFVDGIPSPEDLPGVEAYRFRRPWDRQEDWIMWSTTEETQTITLPARGTNVLAIQAQMGNRYAGTRPVLVDITPHEGEVRIPVGPDTVFVHIQHED